ncbi:MAG: hypothetical protein J6V71_02230 [Clostridia bacterium]|nr:hypothetical protein [Clostridia bacterium]
MKKLFTLFLSVLLCFTTCFMFACKEEAPSGDSGTVSIRYFADGAEMMPLLKQGQLEIGVLPEPAASTLVSTTPNKTFYRVSIQDLYDNTKKAYPQAVIMVKESLLATYPSLATNLQNAFNANLTWTKENIGSAVSKISSAFLDGSATTLKAPMLSSEIIDRCGIFYQSAQDGKQEVKDYIDDIRAIESQSAKAVNDDFFYDGTATGTFSKQNITVVAPDGAPALAIAGFINDNQNFGTDKEMNYTIVPAANIGSYMVTGNGDIVVLPLNAATKLYEQNGYKLVSVVTHGNLYLMSSKPIINLAGQTVGVIGQGAVPDLTFKCILKNNNFSYKVA